MRIGIVSQHDDIGGAAIAAARLHRGLVESGTDSTMIVCSRSTNSSEKTTTLNRGGRAIRLLSRGLDIVTSRAGLRNVSSLNSWNWPKNPEWMKCDIINFHNLHGDYLSYLSLPYITKRKPTLLTLHDMWAYTGHCIYSLDCNRWQSGCGRCPYPDSYPEIMRDNTHLEWKLKRWVYQSSSLNIIAISRWMIGQIEKSMMRELPVHYIPNGLDLTIFRPIEKETARRILNLPINRRLILFATVDTKDPRKGADLLVDALMNLPDSIKSTSDLVIMGKSTGLDLDAIRMNIHKLGYIKDELLKALVYSASDIFAFPTRADNLPLVIQEAMACGTPTVSFDVGGVSELVRNGVTGFLSAPGDKADFSRHISNTLNDVKLLEKLHHQCTDISRKEYSIHLQAERYSNLSNSIISI